MALTLKVHQFEDRNGVSRLVKEVHYVRISHGKEPPLLIQKGKVYSEGGQIMTDLPEWWEEEVKNINPQVLKEVGYKCPQHTRKTSAKAQSST